MYLLEKKQDISPNLGVMKEQRGAESSVIPVNRLLIVGTPYPIIIWIRYLFSLGLFPLR